MARKRYITKNDSRNQRLRKRKKVIKKKPVGRPKKTLKDLPKNWKKIVLNLKKKGASDVEVRAALNSISDDLWYRLIEENEEFSRTIKKGGLLCQTWWEKQGRTNLHSRDFNHGLWYMNMKNRFGWKDTFEHKGKIDTKVTVIINKLKK